MAHEAEMDAFHSTGLAGGHAWEEEGGEEWEDTSSGSELARPRRPGMGAGRGPVGGLGCWGGWVAGCWALRFGFACGWCRLCVACLSGVAWL